MKDEIMNKSPSARAGAKRASNIDPLNKCTKVPPNSPPPRHVSFYIRNILIALKKSRPTTYRPPAASTNQLCEV